MEEPQLKEIIEVIKKGVYEGIRKNDIKQDYWVICKGPLTLINGKIEVLEEGGFGNIIDNKIQESLTYAAINFSREHFLFKKNPRELGQILQRYYFAVGEVARDKLGLPDYTPIVNAKIYLDYDGKLKIPGCIEKQEWSIGVCLGERMSKRFIRRLFYPNSNLDGKELDNFFEGYKNG